MREVAAELTVALGGVMPEAKIFLSGAGDIELRADSDNAQISQPDQNAKP